MVKTTYLFSDKKNSDILNSLPKTMIINIDTFGYSNYFIFRKFYDIISHKKFNKESTYFVFEFTDSSLIEFFFRPLNKHITIDVDNHMNILIDGNYDKSSHEYNVISDYITMFKQFTDNLFNRVNQTNNLRRYLIMFITYLNHNNFKYTISKLPKDINLDLIYNHD